jgi:hypothetical protein
MEKGTEFEVNCKQCGTSEKKHVNDFKAESSKSIIIFGVVIGIFATAVLFYFYGAIATLTFAIPLIFWQQQLKATKAFNSYLVRRR